MAVGIGSEVAWYCPSLDTAGDGTGTLTDLVNGNDGTITNATWETDTGSGGTRALDFSSGYVTIPNSGDLAFGFDPWWFSIWFKLDSTASLQMILDKGFNTGGITRFYFLLLNSTTFRIFTGDVATSLEFGVPSGYLNTWVNVIFQRDGAVVGAWVDGTIADTYGSLSLGRTFTNADILSLGDRSDQTNAFPMSGRLDDTRFGTGVLSSEDIANLSSQRAYQPGGACLWDGCSDGVWTSWSDNWA